MAEANRCNGVSESGSRFPFRKMSSLCAAFSGGENTMRRPLFLVAIILFAASLACGQDAPPQDQGEQLRALLARVELLEKQVAELKAAQTVSAAPTVVAAANPEPSVQAAPSQKMPMSEHGGQVPQE